MNKYYFKFGSVKVIADANTKEEAVKKIKIKLDGKFEDFIVEQFTKQFSVIPSGKK